MGEGVPGSEAMGVDGKGVVVVILGGVGGLVVGIVWSKMGVWR